MNSKKIVITILLVLVALSLVACASDPIEDDILTYVNESLPSILEIDTLVAEEYAAVSGENYTDDATMYYAIKDEIIPDSLELIEASEAIVVQTEEVRTIHEVYINAVNTQHVAFGLILSALENQDYEMISSANEKLSEARALMREYLADLYAIAAEYDIEITEEDFSMTGGSYEDSGQSDGEGVDFGDIPESLVFTYDGVAYLEPELGDFDLFIGQVFATYEEEYPESEIPSMKLYGTGNEGYGYAMNIIFNIDPESESAESMDILSIEIVSLVVSPDPNSGGEEITGQEMVQWVYESF